MPVVAANELVVVVLGVQNPGQHELVLIREAHAARRLPLDPRKAGIIMPINRAMIAMTTSSSMSVKPHRLFIAASPIVPSSPVPAATTGSPFSLPVYQTRTNTQAETPQKPRGIRGTPYPFQS